LIGFFVFYNFHFYKWFAIVDFGLITDILQK